MRHFKIQLFFGFIFSFKIFFSIPVYSQFDGGSGTEDDPYQVATIDQLQEIRNYTDKHFIQVANIDASETENWNDGKGFNPIGDDIVRFVGVYDGNGYVISNLTINRSEGNYVGLFGYISSGKIKNIYLKNANINGWRYVGCIVGRSDYADIYNSISSGSVTGRSEVGGLVGTSLSSNIKNSYSSVVLEGTASVGGISGILNRGKIIRSFFKGSVIGDSNVGGIVGFQYNRAEIIKSYHIGKVSGEDSRVGGLVGSLSTGAVKMSYSKGEIEGNEYDVGGIIGRNHQGKISNSYSLSEVVGNIRVGGLIGANIDFEFADVSQSFAVGRVQGNEDVGGLIGVNGANSSASYWNIEGTEQEKGVGRGITDGVEGLTTTEMTGKAAKENMHNFDFDETWAALDDDYPHLDFQIEEINISLEQYVLTLNETTQATVAVDLIDGTSTTATTTTNYESSDENIATIDENGTVTAHGRGDVTIAASLATHDDEAVITVHAPVIVVQPELLDFEEAKIGNSHQKTITLKNDGDLDLEGSVEISEGSEYFTLITGDGSYSLSPGDSLEIEVQFEPLSFGSFEGTVEVSHNAGNEDDPFSINLTGIGATPTTPILAYPEDEAEGFPTDIDLAWNTAPHTDTYSVQLSTDPDFEHIVIDSTGIADTTIATQALEHSTTYYWRVRGANAGGYGEWSEVWSFTTEDVTSVYEELGVPKEYKLLQNYPNPFNPTTVIRYGIPERSHVTISVYNTLGQRVKTLVNEDQAAQYHETTFDASHLPSGVYIYRLQAGEYVESRRMLYLK